MKHSLLDPATLRQIVFDTLDDSDDFVLVLEQTEASDSGIVVAAANDAFCRASGYDNSELAGRPLHALAAPNSDMASVANVVRAAHDLKSFRSEILCNRANGAPFWLGLHLMPVRHSIPQRFVILGRDITESLQARQQQAAVQGLLAKVFLCVQVPVAIVTEDGLIQMTNPALDDLLGFYPPKGLAGRRAMDCIAPSARASVIAARQKQIENGENYTIPTLLLRSDRTEIAANITSVTVQRHDLRRFRIITLVRTEVDAQPVTVHVAGRIKLVGLQDVRAALGSRWAEAATRAMASAEHVIRRYCGSRDTYSRTADGEFLICFGDASEEEAAFRASTIAREIRKRLIGEGETESVALVSALASAVEVPNEPGRSPDMLSAMINERLNGQLAKIEAQAREILRDAALNATCQLEPVRGPRTNDPVAQYARLPRESEQQIQAAYCTLPSAERESFDFDRLVLGVAAEQVIADLSAGRSTLVLVNVEFDVFLNRRCTERYLAACQALDPRLRARLLLVLAGIPRGTPQGRVLECVTRLRPFCRGMGLQIETLDAPTIDLSLFGSPIVVLHADRLGDRTAKVMAALAKLIVILHGHKARVLIRQVPRSQDAIVLLRESGVDLISMLPLAVSAKPVISLEAVGLH